MTGRPDKNAGKHAKKVKEKKVSNIDIIKTEIDTDPLSRGYSAMSDAEVADDMNTNYRTKHKEFVTGEEIADVIDEVEYNALADAQKDRIINITAKEQINPFGFAATVMTDMLAAGGATIQALIALRTEPQTRGEELNIGKVKAGHVGEARG